MKTSVRKQMSGPRRGVTLTEMLVVLSIIGMLMALLLPAVQQSRETARVAVCKNSLHQISIALLNHESAFRRFPSNGWGYQWYGDPDFGSGPEQPGGWIYGILRYLERRDLASLGQGLPTTKRKAAIAQANQSPLNLFYCPTRRAARLYPFDPDWPPRNADLFLQAAKTDYAINAGDYWIAAEGPKSYAQASDPNYPWPDFSKATGVSYFRSLIGADHITDGKSLTYLVGEKNVTTWGVDLGDDQSVFVGYDLDNSRWTSKGWVPMPDGWASWPERFGSAHAFACQFVFCDGSIREISFNIDAEVHRRLGNRKDGEAIDDADLR